MAGSNNKDGNNFGLFAAVFAAIFGTIYGASKLIEGSMENSMEKRLEGTIDELFLAGNSESVITNALIKDASQKMGVSFNQDMTDKIVALVLKEKIKLRGQNKI
jgi:hypothetical protein